MFDVAESASKSPPSSQKNIMPVPRPKKTEPPRYKQIYEDLLSDIRSGQYPVGTLLPPELLISSKYRASRHTVREAVKLLSNAGVVSRRAGHGTRVEGTEPATQYTQQISKLSDLFNYIDNATLLVESAKTVRVGTKLFKLLDGDIKHSWLNIVAIKFLVDQRSPVAHSQVYVHPDYSGVRADVGKTTLPLSMLIEKKYSQKIIEVMQEFSATPIEGDIAKLLKTKAGTPGLVITRKYYGEQKRLILVTITTFLYKKMKYSMSLRFDAS
jgi:DNA-binding GntR family transcriptional regulator